MRTEVGVGSLTQRSLAFGLSQSVSIGAFMERNEYEITTDSSRFDLTLIHEFLTNSYWARGISRDVVERSIGHSLAFGAFHGSRQVGFARVTTDFATVAYIGDVFVIPEYRGRGIAKLLMRAVLSHSDLQGLRRWLLATRDAHGSCTLSSAFGHWKNRATL